MTKRTLATLAVLGAAAAGATHARAATVYAALEPQGETDRYVVHFSTDESVTRLSFCEPNVRWRCDGGDDAPTHATVSESGAAGRHWFRTDGTVLLWEKKELQLRVTRSNGRTERAVIRFDLKKQLADADLSNPNVGDARPNPAVADKACVFAVSPVPRPNGDGSRGSTYPGHRTSRDYTLRENTPLYSMGTCQVVKRIDDAYEHPCGIGIAMRCKLGERVMGVLYCHMVRPAEKKSFFGIGELVGYSGNTGGSEGPHLHLGMTIEDYDRDAPRDPGLVDEELLKPGLPVPQNNPDLWLRNAGCYRDPRGGQAPERLEERAQTSPASAPRVVWDGVSFVGNEAWDVHE